MAAPAITEENLRNQIDVVKEEIRVNVLNRPYGAFPWLQLPPIAFESFANTHDGYGSFVDLESSTVEDATDFFHRYYAPGNAVLCVGGDLDVEETERLVRRWFGPIEAREVPPTPNTGEPSPTTVRSGVVEDRLAPAPAVAIGWRVPDPVGDLDTYLGTVLLAELLSESDASRLERRLVHDDQLAVAQSSYVGMFGDPFDVRDATLLTTQVHHPASVGVEKVLAAVHEEIGRIATDGVGADELARVQARAEAQLLRQADSVLGRTLAFASAELVHGRAELAGELAARLAAVTPEQVQTAAGGLDPGTAAILELRATGGRR
jgi:predicted Zn-dependent peptidase